MRWTMRCFAVRLLAALLVAIIGFAIFFVGRSTLPQKIGGYEAQSKSYFVDSPSCVAREKSSLTLADLPFVQGEKITFICEREESGKFVQAVLATFLADELWQEEAGGTVSYYAYSGRLPRKVHIRGAAVNLHIAVRGDRVVVGTPIIFGSF